MTRAGRPKTSWPHHTSIGFDRRRMRDGLAPWRAVCSCGHTFNHHRSSAPAQRDADAHAEEKTRS